jgi:hypothetical protein
MYYHPKLKGKAVEVRRVLPWILELVEEGKITVQKWTGCKMPEETICPCGRCDFWRLKAK